MSKHAAEDVAVVEDKERPAKRAKVAEQAHGDHESDDEEEPIQAESVSEEVKASDLYLDTVRVLYCPL